MTDQKIIAVALVLSALLIAGGLYYSKQAPTTPAAILPSATPDSPTITENGLIIGNPDAPVVIEEYTNFLCPACASFATGALEQIKNDYVKTGKAKLVLFIYPPQELAKAALCANEQGKFTEYHDYLFSHQKDPGITKEQDIKDFAVNAGLDGAAFDACY
ncbi:MAG: thioredoxin domain-containing protein, partial [Patescibacteria group bacterium]